MQSPLYEYVRGHICVCVLATDEFCNTLRVLYSVLDG